MSLSITRTESENETASLRLTRRNNSNESEYRDKSLLSLTRSESGKGICPRDHELMKELFCHGTMQNGNRNIRNFRLFPEHFNTGNLPKLLFRECSISAILQVNFSFLNFLKFLEIRASCKKDARRDSSWFKFSKFSEINDNSIGREVCKNELRPEMPRLSIQSKNISESGNFRERKVQSRIRSIFAFQKVKLNISIPKFHAGDIMCFPSITQFFKTIVKVHKKHLETRI